MNGKGRDWDTMERYKRIAHRGFSSEAPENTYSSFALAVEGDFFGIECDIWKSKDGIYVVSHDGNLQRMCGVDRSIPDMTYSEIQSYPVTKGKKNLQHPVQHLIRLTDYLSIMNRSESKLAVIELKMNYTTVELREIVDLVKEYGLYDRTVFISLHGGVLIRLKTELGFPSERLQYVYGAISANKWNFVPMELEQWLIENRINLDSRYSLISKGTVMRLHEAGLLVNVWTVNKKTDILHMIHEVGVDMVTTEYYYDL